MRKTFIIERWMACRCYAALLALAWSIVPCHTAFSQTTPHVAFDVVTIKPSKEAVGGMGLGRSSPNGISLINTTAKSLMRNAYGVKEELISGGPNWINTSEYDVEAKVLNTDAVAPPLSRDQIKQMIQALLADRFKLVAHTEMKEIPVYELTIAKAGPKLQEAKSGDTYANGLKGPDGRTGAGLMMIVDGKFTGQGISISGLVDTLSLVLGRTVVDKTGLTGKYDITLLLPRPEGAAGPMPTPSTDASAKVSSETSSPAFFTVLEEQLGLKLHSAKGLGKTLVIDHIEKPSEN